VISWLWCGGSAVVCGDGLWKHRDSAETLPGRFPFLLYVIE